MSTLFARLQIARAATVLLAGICAAGLTIPVSAHAQGLFQSPSSVQPTGFKPQAVAAADLARSGFQSLVVTDSNNANMKVYLATGPGTFNPAFTYATCSGPTAVVAHDFTGDGYPDIAVACPASNAIDVFLNQGSGAPGSFGSPVVLNVTDPVALATYPNVLGLAVASGSGGITIFLNDNGTLVTKTVAASGSLTGIVVGDFNRDGNLDLAVSDKTNNQVQIFTGDGTGNLTPAGTYPVGTSPSGIVAADFNKDGKLDLAVTNAGSNNVTMLLGNGDGTFAVQPNPQSAGIDPIGIVTTDVNSDGNPDVIAVDAQISGSTTLGAYAVLLGNGDGTLQAPQISNQADVPGPQAALADFNRDGKPDMALVGQFTNAVALFLNNTLPTPYPGGRSFSSPTAVSAGNGNMADSVTAADFNLDGRLDVAVSYLEDNDVRVLLNNGSGGFNLSAAYPTGNQPYFVTSGDLNSDGKPDLVVVNSSVNDPNGSISVLLNNGNGTFAAAANYDVGRLPYQAAIGDVNGDGYPDIAVTNYGANTVSILYGSKTGTFTPGPTLATGPNPYGIAIADFAHNGHPDIAVTCYGSNMLYVFPNNGDGTFGSPFITSTGSGPMSLVTGDFNRDGNLDIVVANATGGPAGDTDPTTSGNNISFFAGNGNGIFQAGVISPSLNFPDSIAAGDVNGDGILDVVGVAPNFNEVVVTLGKGDGTFGTIQQRGVFGAPKQPWGVTLGDFNNDGELDIVTANTYNQVNITVPAYQNRYMTQYPPVAGGNPSVDLLTNLSASTVALSFSPPSPLPANNTGTTITAVVNPRLSGPTPTGSVIFEDSTGTPLGTGPYPLNSGGLASVATGHLGSGAYTFTTLYSGDANYQPSTGTNGGFALTVNGTPVTLSLSASSIQYGSSFTATVTAVGNATTGSYPHGTATIYAVTSGGSTINLGTTAALQQVGGGNNSTRTLTVSTTTANLNVGSYQLYAIYNPSNGTYPTGSSSNVALTVTLESTSLDLGCQISLFSLNCTATVTATGTTPPTAVPSGSTVDFTLNGGAPTVELTNTSGQAQYGPGGFYLGTYTIVATFPQQGNYATSTDSTTVFCLVIVCGGGSAQRTPVTLDSFSGLGVNANTSTNTRNRFRRVPFTLF